MGLKLEYVPVVYDASIHPSKAAAVPEEFELLSERARNALASFLADRGAPVFEEDGVAFTHASHVFRLLKAHPLPGGIKRAFYSLGIAAPHHYAKPGYQDGDRQYPGVIVVSLDALAYFAVRSGHPKFEEVREVVRTADITNQQQERTFHD